MSEDLVKIPGGAIAMYDPGLPAGDEEGMENITSSDVKLPFVAIAQKTSKCLDVTEGKFIAGVSFGDLYNSESREVYGKGPILFMPVLMGKRAHLKKPNGTLGDRVAWDDPRVTWEGAKAAGRQKPEGVRIYDWAVLLLPTFERVVLSFQSTSFGAGMSLNTVLDKYRTLARISGKGFRAFQLKFEATVFIDKNDMGAFGKLQIGVAGGSSASEYAYANSWFNTIKDKTIVTGDLVEEEGAGAEQEQPASAQPVGANDIPF